MSECLFWLLLLAAVALFVFGAFRKPKTPVDPPAPIPADGVHVSKPQPEGPESTDQP